MKGIQAALMVLFLIIIMPVNGQAATNTSIDVNNPDNREINRKCVRCHLKENKALVLQWENSPHAKANEGQIGCYTCHAAKKGDELGFLHEGAFIKAVLSPNDCRPCHEQETEQMALSRHSFRTALPGSLKLAVSVIRVPNIPKRKFMKSPNTELPFTRPRLDKAAMR